MEINTKRSWALHIGNQYQCGAVQCRQRELGAPTDPPAHCEGLTPTPRLPLGWLKGRILFSLKIQSGRNQPRIVSTFLNYKTAGTDWTDSIIGYFRIITSWLLVSPNHIFHIILLHSTYFTGSCDASGHPEPAVRCCLPPS